MNRKLVAPMLPLGAYTPAPYNLSNDSDNFRVMRRAVFVNGITDKHLLNIEGLRSITKDNGDAQLEGTCKTGDGEHKKHYPGISDNATYRVEQFRPEELLSMCRSVEATTKFSKLGTVLINTEGNERFKAVTERYKHFWVNQLDVPLSSGVSDAQMFKTVEEDWMMLV